MQNQLIARRWRAVALLAVGMVVGIMVIATPAASHVGGTVGHLWNKHIKPRTDARYYTKTQAEARYYNVGETAAGATNADQLDGIDSTGFLGASGKAADAEKLDGIDSSGFVKGGGQSVEGSAAVPIDSTSTVTSIDGFGTIEVAEDIPSGGFSGCRAVFTNQSGGTLFRNGITERSGVVASGVGNVEPVVADGGTFELTGTGFRPRGAFGTWQIATPELDRVLTLVVAVNYSDLPQPVTCNAAVQGTFRQF